MEDLERKIRDWAESEDGKEAIKEIMRRHDDLHQRRALERQAFLLCRCPSFCIWHTPIGV